MTKPFLGALVLVAGGAAIVVLAGLTDVRYDLQGLQAVAGRVIEADSRKPGRHSGYSMHVTLEVDGRRLLLEQSEVGGYAHRLAPGQLIRAWIGPQTRDSGPPVHRVWQIERGGQVVMPVMAVGDELYSQVLWEFLLGGFLVVSGLLWAAKTWPGAEPAVPTTESETRS
jgi:hypothetical protein